MRWHFNQDVFYEPPYRTPRLTLKPNTRDQFHRLYIEEALPHLQRWNFDVLAYGPSLHDENTYFLIHRFDSLAHREQSEAAFYGSDEWRKGPRETTIALIENYAETVIELDDNTVQGLRNTLSSILSPRL